MNTAAEQERKAVQPNEGSAANYNHIENVVVVMSGKGGVGKSLVTGLMASALARVGYQVGILDADITGPSIPMLFGLHGPVQPGEVGIQPLESRFGIKVISMNLLLASEDQPVIWRGPMVSKAIKQLWGDVMWGKLDYLLVDLPPGTSDATLTIMQSLPIAGIVMVTTPQGLANLIVRKAVNMAHTVGVNVSGVVENMAYFTCPDSGKPHFIFGPSHTDEVIATAGAPLLARLPIDPQIAALCDKGKIEDVDIEEITPLMETFLKAIPASVAKEIDASLGYRPASSRNKPATTVVSSYKKSPTDPSGKPVFSEKALQLIAIKENIGCLEDPDARGVVTGWCGDTMRIDLRLVGGLIKDARYMTDGCGATIACGSMITKMAISKTLVEAERILPGDIIDALDGLPEDHLHCADLAVMTLRKALQTAKKR